MAGPGSRIRYRLVDLQNWLTLQEVDSERWATNEFAPVKAHQGEPTPSHGRRRPLPRSNEPNRKVYVCL
jgi:hypothetical protein